MAVCAFVGYHGPRCAFGMFGASVLGPMILSALASILGLIENPAAHRGADPRAVRDRDQHRLALRRCQRGTSLRHVISASGGLRPDPRGTDAGLSARIIYLLGINDLLHGILAFAPGGQPEMVMLAILTGADITYVIFHHVLRLLLVMSMTPFLSRWLA